MKEQPEFRTERSLAQKAKDYAALKLAKRQEAERLKNGGKYVRQNNRTYVLKSDSND